MSYSHKISFLVFLVLSQNLYSGSGLNTNTKFSDLYQKIGVLKNSMVEYMKNAKPSYSMVDIESCASILKSYLKQVEQSKTKAEMMKIVKKTVLDLNKLNDKCGGQLVETGEREQIAEIIILAGKIKGYNKEDEDITEKWRDW